MTSTRYNLISWCFLLAINLSQSINRNRKRNGPVKKKVIKIVLFAACSDREQELECTLPISKVQIYLPIIWKKISALGFNLRYHLSELENTVFCSSQVRGEAWVKLIKSVVDSKRGSFSMTAKSFSFQSLEEEHSQQLARSISVFLYIISMNDIRSIRNTIHYTVTHKTDI